MTPTIFGTWTPLETEVRGPLRDATRAVAEQEFARLMSARSARVAALAALAGSHGVDLQRDDAPVALGTWLVVAAGGAGADALRGDEAWRWAGLAADISLWLGERIIAAAASAGGQVCWQFYTGIKKSTGYHRAVLTGFRRVDDPRYYVDIAHFVGSWFELAARRRPARPDFLATIETATLADA